MSCKYPVTSRFPTKYTSQPLHILHVKPILVVYISILLKKIFFGGGGGGGRGEWHLSCLPSLNDVYTHVHCTCQHKKSIIHCFFFISLRTHARSDPSLQVCACNLLSDYLTHKETNMKYMYLALESLSHLATFDLSREAVKKHQDTVLEQLKVSSVTVCTYNVHVAYHIAGNFGEH